MSSSPPKKKQLLLTQQDMAFELPNDDLTIEVLTRLPAKSVLRFNCVSKGWQRITSDVSFRRIQSQRSKPIVSGFYFQERFQWCDEDIEAISYISVDSKKSNIYNTTLDFLPEKVVLLASSNGLLCCRSFINAHHPVIYMCNPCNKEYITLEWVGPIMNGSVALVLDPFHDSGRVSASFKLVIMCKIEDVIEPHFSFQLYSSKTGIWKSMEEVCFDNSNLLKNKGFFANGLLHWLTDSDKIITFDVETEKPRLIDAPPITQCKSVTEMCIGEYEGCLHYINISEIGFQDWILKDASKPEWELKHSISLDLMEEEYPRFLYNMSRRVKSRVCMDVKSWVDPLAFKDGLLFLTVCSSVYSFKFETMKLKKLCSLASLGPNALGAPIVLPYSMSLVPLDNPVVVL